jgi:hypothetical protein
MSNGGIFMMTVMEAMCGHNSMDSAQVWASYCCCLKSSLEETHTNTALMIWHSFEGKHTKHLLHSLGSKFTTLDSPLPYMYQILILIGIYKYSSHKPSFHACRTSDIKLSVSVRSFTEWLTHRSRIQHNISLDQGPFS